MADFLYLENGEDVMKTFDQSKLEKYYDKIISSDVFLRLENTSDKENKTVEIKINVPGDDFVVKKTAKSFEEGVDLAVDSLERVIVKRKEKLRAI